MSKDIRKSLEHCVEWNCVDCPNKEELGSGEIVCSSRLLSKAVDYVSDLEAKLAESESKAYTLESNNIFLNNQCKKLIKENKQLKQQLAEKEKELYYKTAECEKWKADYENCSRLEKLMTKEHQYCLDNWRASVQDKISFAVEQIRELKKSLRNKVCLMENDEHCYPQNSVHWQDVVALIDNQIKDIRNKQDGIH